MNANVRRPAVAGSFYPGSSSELTATVDKYLAETEEKELQGELIALIAPHAGYVYSGHVAAYAYKQLQGKSIDTVVLIGPSHRYSVRGAAVYGSGAFQTPLGTVEIDEQLVSELIEQEPRITSAPQSHDDEHCLEELLGLETYRKLEHYQKPLCCECKNEMLYGGVIEVI